MSALGRACVTLLPWALRRPLLERVWGFRFGPGSGLGRSWVWPRELELGAGAWIGHGTVIKGLRRVELGPGAVVGNLNWITGYPAGDARHFAHLPDRDPVLVLGAEAAVTSRHLIDCTDRVELGERSILAGFRSQVLTHAIDFAANRQSAAPIRIGVCSFVGTQCVLLGGSSLPDFSILAALSLLNDAPGATHRLYAGVPAAERKALPPDLAFFRRERGFVA